MRIGFDAKKLVSNFTGIGNYSRGAINALSAHYPDNDYLLFAPSCGKEQVLRELNPSPAVSLIYPSHNFAGRIGREWWRNRGVVSELENHRIDLFHGLSNELPWGIETVGCKSVVTIHDLIFLRYPQTYSWADREILKAKTRHACRCADHIIACSQQTADDLVELYRVAPEKISVVYQGCAAAYAHRLDEAEVQAVGERHGLPEHYWLCVGTIEERKNQLILLQALARSASHHHLVLVGRRTPYQDKIERAIVQLGLQGRVHILNNVPFTDLPAIYQGCSIFLYMSLYEGFGIPVLEAMNSAVPVIAATGSCLEEVGGDACLYSSPHDADSLATLIDRLQQSPDEMHRRVALGLERTRLFTSDAVAQGFMSVYEKILHTK